MSLENGKAELMGMITLYTGGCRSGKSRLASEQANKLSEKVCFIATCVPQDEEMKQRVQKHREDRPADWHVIEEPLNVSQVIRTVDRHLFPVILVDCLTLWVCNLMCKKTSPVKTEQDSSIEAEKLIESAREYGGDVIFVSNEVGLGIVPDNEMSRTYVDLAGRCNQAIAKGADNVIFVSCGIGITLKQE